MGRSFGSTFIAVTLLACSVAQAGPRVNLAIPRIDLRPGERICGFDIAGSNLILLSVKTPTEWTIDIDNSSSGPHLRGTIKVGSAALDATGLNNILEFEEEPTLGPATVKVIVIATKDFERERRIVLSPHEARLIRAPANIRRTAAATA
jgi:hypothetical protein